MISLLKLFAGILVLVITLKLSSSTYQDHSPVYTGDSTSFMPLISDTNGMETAWDFPRNPLTDSLLQNSYLADQIRFGFRIFVDTSNGASRFSANKLTCTNCHINAGQRERALPLVGVAGMYPEYNRRGGRLFSLEDRIVECFKRSIDASETKHNTDSNYYNEADAFPTTDSKEVLALSAYITWLSSGYPVGKNIPWRGQNFIPRDSLIPVDKLDPKRGEVLYMERCINCHDENGQGVEIGDKKAGPLWGSDSWNDGAGAARIYTLAGMFRYSMPYQDPGSLTDEEAQLIAAFINSKPRPRYPFKDKDYPGEKIPPDAVYYRR